MKITQKRHMRLVSFLQLISQQAWRFQIEEGFLYYEVQKTLLIKVNS